MQTAMMMRKLKAAEPTIVLGPRSPAKKPLPTTSTTFSRISGADEPSAISVSDATVPFHTFSRMVTVLPRSSLIVRSRSWLVIVSIDSMNTSLSSPTPMNA